MAAMSNVLLTERDVHQLVQNAAEAAVHVEQVSRVSDPRIIRETLDKSFISYEQLLRRRSSPSLSQHDDACFRMILDGILLRLSFLSRWTAQGTGLKLLKSRISDGHKL